MTMLQFADLPYNIHAQVVEYLDLQDRLRLSRTSKTFFNTIIPIVYSRVIYVDYSSRQSKNSSTSILPIDSYTLIDDSNIKEFFNTLHTPGILGINYSTLLQEIYLDGYNLHNPDFDILSWRSHKGLYFPNAKVFQLPSTITIEPLSHLEVPQLTDLYLDTNFCDRVQRSGMLDFIDFSRIENLHFAARLSNNEDMVIFNLLTKNPMMLKNLKGLHFHTSQTYTYEKVYRRVVGFFAILRKMGVLLGNVTKLSIPMTNQTSSPILHLISRHIIFENLQSLELFIYDDSFLNGNILQLAETVHTLGTIVKSKGRNITNLSINYWLDEEDEDKNNLRAMLLLRLTESFTNLKKLYFNLKIECLSFSNLFMILGSVLTKNQNSLVDIRLNVRNPSENLIGNLLPNVEQFENIFPEITFLSNCDCSKCEQVNILFPGKNTVVDESIKVSTLMAIGNELNYVQKMFEEMESKSTYFSGLDSSRFFIKPKLNEHGFLFDHLLKRQMNSSLKFFKNIDLIDLCGLTYLKDSNTHEFSLVFGDEFNYFDKDVLNAIIEIAQMFGGNLSTPEIDMTDAHPIYQSLPDH